MSIPTIYNRLSTLTSHYSIIRPPSNLLYRSNIANFAERN